ncbi:uncharacterized protein EI90DRAFT_3152096 [Cantharellus anzutake]|uniref:uncharacterized protein n=1 Tax=Cantharellus anzutake TaxID=1750568 RepID=UPI00190442C9|nr:uncharacterized protein EI90DRAFT_3152096 [Cantharellus anzutake]KAF8337394.1 hypothetical protein EI90DRAFT_3152096 [Cantharellus anzutake]
MSLLDDDFEGYLLGEVRAAEVHPFSADFGVSHQSTVSPLSPLLTIVHNGSMGRFHSERSISIWYRRRVVTLYEVDSSWYSRDVRINPAYAIKLIAVHTFRSLGEHGRASQVLTADLALSAGYMLPPSTQEAEVDSMSNHSLDDGDSLDMFEDITRGGEHDEIAVGGPNEETQARFAESVLNEGDEHIGVPLPLNTGPTTRYFGHHTRQNGSDARLAGHPSITYYCIRSRRTVTLAVPQSWNWTGVMHPGRIIQWAIILLYNGMGGEGDVEALLDDNLYAQALEQEDETNIDSEVE